MSVKKSQAIVKCFIDVKNSVWFTLRKTKPCFVTQLFSCRLPVKPVFQTLNDRQSAIFSGNLTNRKNPTNLNYHMSIKKSQAILKRFIDLKFSVWFTLGSENETMFCETWNFFQFPLSSFLFPLAYCRPAVDLKKVLSVTKHGFVF